LRPWISYSTNLLRPKAIEGDPQRLGVSPCTLDRGSVDTESNIDNVQT
jgi:hypothetical protein